MNIESQGETRRSRSTGASHIWRCTNCDGTSITEKESRAGAEELGRKHVQMNPACSYDDVEVIQLDSQAKRLQWIINRG